MGGLFSMLSPNTHGADHLRSERGGPGLRVRTAGGRCSAPSWLHAGVLHILFNMMAVRQLAPGVAELYGPGRTVIIYTAGSRRRVRAELVRRGVPAAVAVPARQPITVGRLGVDCRAHRRHPRLRPPQRQQHGAQPRVELHPDARRLWLPPPRHRQLRACRRLRRRLPGGQVPRSAEARTRRSHRRALACLAASLLSIVWSVLNPVMPR